MLYPQGPIYLLSVWPSSNFLIVASCVKFFNYNLFTPLGSYALNTLYSFIFPDCLLVDAIENSGFG